MANQAYKFYKDLPPWAKGVVVVGGSLVTFLVLKRVYSALFPTEKQKQNRQLLQNVNNEIQSYQTNGIKPSFPDSQYETLANTIYNSMRFAAGDDYATVELKLKEMKNNLDVAKLIKAFGKRQDFFFGIPVGDPMDLFTYVQKELGNDYAGLTNYRVKNVNADWKKKGITYQI
jgi:hypothetical protein